MTIAVYAGLFDPITFGHEDIIHRASALFGKIIIAVGTNNAKRGLFDRGERLDLIRKSFGHNAPFPILRDPEFEVDVFDGLLVEYAKRKEATVLVRGARSGIDYESELVLAHANRDLGPNIETVHLPTRLGLSAISSSLVREIASHGGDVSRYVNPVVEMALRSKLKKT